MRALQGSWWRDRLGLGSMQLVQLAPQALSSHPATEKRLRRLEAKWRKLKDKSGFIEYEQQKRE